MMSVHSEDRRVAAIVVGVFLFSMACHDLTPPSGVLNPTTPPSAPADPATRPLTAPPFPAVPNASAVFAGPNGLYDDLSAYHGGSLPTRYVFFADGTFRLQFSSARFGLFEYGGRYSQADSLLTFSWEGWSTAGPWSATGIRRGEELEVRYNVVMLMTDFIDGVYVLVR